MRNIESGMTLSTVHDTLMLTLSGKTDFGLFYTRRVCRQQFQFYENGRKFSKQVENTVGKREFSHNEQFFLFPQCFQNTWTADTQNKACFEMG